MFRFIICLSLAVCMAIAAAFPALAQGPKQYSVNSMIVEVEASACLGQERSRVQTEKLAMDEARRTASEYAMTYVSSETGVENGRLVKDLVEAYSKATVRVLEELEKGWRQSEASGGFVDACYHVKIKAEVTPAKMENSSPSVQASMADPRAPLTVELWTDRDSYRVGDAMKFFFRGNKPFYARAVYVDAEGNLIEVTPYRKARYYKGGVTYEIPGEGDQFTLMITPPLGEEQLILYTSTQPLDSYSGQEAGAFYEVRGGPDLGQTTRGLTVLQGVPGAGKQPKAEFAETKVDVRVEQ
ncbi:DUF4384 domain-containing protein [Pseudodesulfovibrio indicus]|uniref:DUF4384 domain-containing protein n=1 Tax=Pseudodesulfovibrio indicus TaxID=1716143 RepID=UPI00292F39F5|nr:DUF4384 domain-containing protein [Pseudodesulfovibrio indicus]